MDKLQLFFDRAALLGVPVPPGPVEKRADLFDLLQAIHDHEGKLMTLRHAIERAVTRDVDG